MTSYRRELCYLGAIEKSARGLTDLVPLKEGLTTQLSRCFGNGPSVLSTFMVVMALCLSPAAFSQQASASPSSASPSSQNDQLEEVIVTAERRSENLQKTAIAATVLNGDELVQKGVVQMADLQNASPSLSITPAGLTANVNIRGIGLDSGSPAVVPGVATYRDGLWQPPILTTDTLYDVGSAEVLRGPQGTFVGSNSTGGAIFINSRDPDFNGLSGDMQVQGGNFSDFGARGAVNLPIDDTWAARVAFNAEQRDSFYTDIGSQVTSVAQQFNPAGALDEKDMRFGLHGKPNEDLDILLKVEANSKSTGGYAYKPVPGTEYAPYASPDPWVLNYDHYTLNDELSVRNSLKIDWDIGGSGITFRSLSGVQFMRVHNIEDADATASTLPGPPALSTTQAIIERPLTQEFNLISPTSGRLQWVVGTFYLHDIREIALDIQSQAIPNNVLPNFVQKLDSEAVFGQVSYQIAPPLQLQVGLRYTHDINEIPEGGDVTIELGIPGAPNIVIPQWGEETDSATTGKVALNWTVDENNFLYVFAAKGFKAGGFNAAGATYPQANFAPEVVWDYEAGWKANFFQNHLRTSLGGFWDNYTDLQVGAFDPNTAQSSLINTGKSVIKGGEFELHGKFAALQVDAGAAYVNSRLGAISLVNTEALPPGVAAQDLPQCAVGATPPGCFNYNPYIVNLAGEQNPYSPEWTFNAGVQYGIVMGSGSTLTPRVNYSYIGHQWTTLFEQPMTDYLSAYGLWSGSLTYERQAWRIQAYGLNLANKLYVSGQFAAGGNPDEEFFGNPRQYGIRIGRTF
jgi:iron complex outermembrane recepter protein